MPSRWPAACPQLRASSMTLSASRAPGTGAAATDVVAAALARSGIADTAELTVDQPCPGTVVLTGAVRTRSDHDLATATARSVAGVTAVDDCIDDEC